MTAKNKEVKVVFHKSAVTGDVTAVQRVVTEAGLEQKIDACKNCYVIKISSGIGKNLSARIRKMKGVKKIK